MVMGQLWTHKSVKGLGALACCTALTLGIAACSGSSSSSSSASTSTSTSTGSGSGALEQTHLTVGALPVVDDAGLYIAIKEGYFKQVGLTVSPVPVTVSTSAIPDMVRGTVDIIGGANYVSFFQAQASGTVSLKILADATHCKSDTFNVLALPKSGITSPKDLAGKTVAVNVTNNVQTLTLNDVLKADGVNPSAVHYKSIPFPNMIAALKDHQVDAISVVEPFVTAAEEELGAVNVVSQCTGPTANFPMSGYFSTAAWAQKNPNTAKAFQKAIDKAQALADSDPQLVRQVLPTYTKISSKAADVLNLNTYPTSVSTSAMQDVATLMRTQGMLSKPLNVNSMIFP